MNLNTEAWNWFQGRSFGVSLLCRFPLFALGNHAGQQDYKCGNDYEPTSPFSPCFGWLADQPRKKKEPAADANKPSPCLCILGGEAAKLRAVAESHSGLVSRCVMESPKQQPLIRRPSRLLWVKIFIAPPIL